MPTPLRHLTHLHCNISNGIRAPHKPILMLAVIEAYRQGLLTSNEIPISPELVGLFKQIWAQLVVTPHHPNMSYPFYYLTGDKFWTLVPKTDVEVVRLLGSKARNLATLDAAVAYAVITPEIAEWMMDPERRAILEHAVLEKYFPDTRFHYRPSPELPNMLAEIQTELLETPPSLYRKEIQEFMAAEDGEEIYLRSAVFRRLIPQVYHYTCAITRWRITTTNDDQLIDACHILPFCESYDDTITNGIALSPTLHRAFDRGLVGIADDYTVIVKSTIQENDNPYGLRKLHGRSLLLPDVPSYRPRIENLRLHRQRWNL